MVVSKKNDNLKVSNTDSIDIYFDGRRDSTRTMINDSNGQLHPIIIKDQHITVTVEPGGQYLGHFTPDVPIHPDKPAKNVAKGVYLLLQQYNLIQSCLVLGADGTAINTG